MKPHFVKLDVLSDFASFSLQEPSVFFFFYWSKQFWEAIGRGDSKTEKQANGLGLTFSRHWEINTGRLHGSAPLGHSAMRPNRKLGQLGEQNS